MIRVDNLVYEYPGKRALDNVSFALEPGSITALVGPNGAGKTTLLRCLSAIEIPYAGTVLIDRLDTEHHPREVHKKLGYLSDFFGIYENLTVRQCLYFAARLHQLDEADISRRIDWVSELLELGEHLNNPAGTLSRGWRQRLGIAQAVIHQPKILLLDEPASGLDPEARSTLSVFFKRLQQEGMTLIVSSHILAELEDYCSSMLVLREGKIAQHLSSMQTENNVQHVHIELLKPAGDYRDKLAALPDVTILELQKNHIQLQVASAPEKLHQLLKTLLESGLPISEFYTEERTLQDQYLATRRKEADHAP